ncbi:uncharacterized protein LOC127256492 isoform X2 [Andrographis paniculata]|uniref:uncharacterized protein LOC127256492 isoform X2 n=1 Tax=Andrographis paniculata TaxID=175694 RepID=UPI0021E9378C|nr:uncharacterized protein LOC127256492 isoform X2 [Andrographis paniculata]
MFFRMTQGQVLELEPMNPYERLLVHRLAEIFGFSHHSVGEGEARHLMLERCPETSIPPILVTDLLWQFGEVPSPTIYDVPRQKNVVTGQSDVTAGETSLKEREANYKAARDIIFSSDTQTHLVKQRPRNDTVVARRMISHALGKINKEPSQEHSSGGMDQMNVSCRSNSHTSSNASSDAQNFNGAESSTSKLAQQKINLAQRQKEGSLSEQKDSSNHESQTRNEQMGAAKRLFANALGIDKRDINRSKNSITKKTNG